MAYSFFGLLLCFIALDLIWWRVADRHLRRMPGFLLWRIAFGGFMAAMLAYLVCSKLFLRSLGRSDGPLPISVHAVVYLWHFLFLPASILGLGIAAIWRKLAARVAGSRGRGAGPNVASLSSPNPDDSIRTGAGSTLAPPRIAPTRRQMLAAAAIALPPLGAAAAAVGTVRNMHGRRLRHFNLALPTLPPQLDGMTIVHLSDTHIGKFLHHDRLPAIADDVNKLEADFVVFTGDLIDLSLDDLPHGIKFLRSLRSRCGQAICEGNHDLLEGYEGFESRMRGAGMPLMVSDQSVIHYTSRDGRSCPVQFLGVPWTESDDERSLAIQDLHPIARPDVFRIVLAHHPHSFDAAAAAGFPLVLSGHTHGGQINFNKRVGVGSMRFKYISGHYTKAGSNLIVNNGLGNWFPLRINAPAEIVHITLKTTRA